MTFQDLADTLGLSAGGIRVLFCQKKWSIHRPEDVRKFLATRFSSQKTKRVQRSYQTGAHLKKWQFTKKTKQVEVSPAEEKLARESALTAAKERKIAAVARVAVAEKSAEQAEKIRILEEKLAGKEALVAAKERKIAALMRRAKSENPTPLSFGHLPLAGENETPTPLPRGVPNKVRRGSPTEKPEPQIAENPTPDFGTVPSAESRKAAARARRKENKGRERKSSFRETENRREQKPLSRVPETPVVEVGDENLCPTTPVEVAETPEIKAKTKVEPTTIPVEKIEPEKESNPENPSIKQIKVQDETLTTEITALRIEIREQIGKIEIKKIATLEVFEEIPIESLVAETAQSRIEPQVQQTIEKNEPQIAEQPKPQNTPPNPAS